MKKYKGTKVQRNSDKVKPGIKVTNKNKHSRKF